MNKQQIEADLYNWMISFVEIPNSKLGNWPPCPYARKARLDNKFKIIFADGTDILSSIEQAKTLLENNDVVAVCFDQDLITANEIENFVLDTNQSLMLDDYVILEDHPAALEYVNGVNMNFGGCGLLLVQKLTKLTDASDQLKIKGYYDQWDQPAFDSVVAWRKI